MMDIRGFSRWAALFTLALAICVLIPLSSFAQEQSREQTDFVKKSYVESPASGAAAPAPLPPAGNWTGVYIGGHIGGGWGRANTSFTPLPSATQFINLLPQTLKPDPSGVNGGLQGGYNHQFGNLVVGGEMDISWSNMDGTATLSPFTRNNGATFNGTLTAHQDTSWFSTVRPRLGVAIGRTLLYGTAGLAFGHVNYAANSDFRPLGTLQYPAAFGKTKTGWTGGGGGEFAIARHWSIKGEYLYYDLRSESFIANAVPFPNPPFQVGYKWETKAHTLNGGLNFHF